MAQLEDGDLDGLMSAPAFQMARSLADMPADVLPALLQERLNEGERALLGRAASTEPAAPASDCVNALRRRRLEREVAGVQEEIDRLQTSPQGTEGAHDQRFADLWAIKLELHRRLEALND